MQRFWRQHQPADNRVDDYDGYTMDATDTVANQHVHVHVHVHANVEIQVSYTNHSHSILIVSLDHVKYKDNIRHLY